MRISSDVHERCWMFYEEVDDETMGGREVEVEDGRAAYK